MEGTDDFASMHEVVGRYFRRRLDEQKPLPDLVVIDGGKGQLSAAARRARASSVSADLPLISLAKREEEIFVAGPSDPCACRGDRRRCACCSRRATRRIASR